MNKKSFWPYGILISIVLCICACAYTIYICLDYPVYTDNGMFASYQEVDYNINDMQDAQTNFENEFGKGEFMLFANNKLVNDNIKLRRQRVVNVVDAGANLLLEFTPAPKNSKVYAFLTRPETSVYDKNLTNIIDDNKIKISDINPEKLGRWQVKLKVDASDEHSKKVGIYGFEFFIR